MIYTAHNPFKALLSGSGIRSELSSNVIVFAQNFRIVRAVPETLNSGAFLFKICVFGASNFRDFQKFPGNLEQWVVRGVPRPRKSDLAKKTPELAVLCPVLAILKF